MVDKYSNGQPLGHNKECSEQHNGCRHFDEWKYSGKNEQEKCITDLKYAATILDKCWGHDNDGSELIVDSSELFNRVFNKVIRLIEKTNKKIELGFPKPIPEPSKSGRRKILWKD
jgi:hypothetical protein